MDKTVIFNDDKEAMQIYEMLLNNDEDLMGHHWEEVGTSDYDTFASILSQIMETMKNNKIEIYDETTDDYVALGNEKSRTKAMLMYMQTVIDGELEDLGKR